MKFSLFINNKAHTPATSIGLEDFINGIKAGVWAKQIERLRDTPKESPSYKKLKNALPGATISAEFKSRAESVPLNKRLKQHTGLICIDIDKKDNPKLKVNDLLDKECVAQFTSCSGEGVKIVYYCKPVTEAAKHRRIYDAVIERLDKKGLQIKVDPIVKSIGSLQYVSYDSNTYYNPKSKLRVQPLAEIKKAAIKPRAKDPKSDLVQLNDYVDALGAKDITKEYEDWLILMFGISYSLGELGRPVIHRLCKHYKGYSKYECDEKYDSCLERQVDDKPVTVASVFQLINNNLSKPKVKQLSKKYSVTHVIGEAEEAGEGNQDLAGFVRFKLFLFKKIINKETNVVEELQPNKLNLNEFEVLLKTLGFYRYENTKVKFVRIVDNIVEAVDVADILRIVTEYIEKDGDYKFTYRKTEYTFSWEEIAHKWREVRALSTTWNQIAASLPHWVPDLLRDSIDVSYVPYANGVVKVDKKEVKLLPYSAMTQQIWKERILGRNFKYSLHKGMFEEFFINVCGRGSNMRERLRAATLKRALWYMGYMLQGTKRKSLARAWMLYDIKVGNNGRTGKSIIGEAVGKIRSMITIDGKTFDPKNRFAFQKIMPWTDVVFIDDPSKYMSIIPLFNMITGETDAEKKGKDPFSRQLKFLFASNWIMETEGTSEAGRQFITQIDDFYVRYGIKNKNSIQPIVDYHGKEFFTDWNEKDWSEFDSFCMRCLKAHLAEPAPENTIIGNATLIRFVQVNEEELFYELASTFCNNVKQAKDGSLLITQQNLIQVVRDHNEALKGIKAGRIAREFLTAINAGRIELTSMQVGSMVKMAYKMHNHFDQLDFGSVATKLPKPKF